MIALSLALMVATTGVPPDQPPVAPVIHVIQAKPAKTVAKAKCANGGAGATCAPTGATPVGTKTPVGTTRPVGTPG